MQRQEVVGRGASVIEAVLARGWARFSATDDAAFVELARELGDVVADTPVRLIPGKRTYLTSPGAIPVHTDHSMADLIAWRCEAQDERDGASLLVDGREVVAELGPDVRRVLTKTRLPAMVRLGDQPVPTAVLSDVSLGAAIFYAPWLEPLEPTPDSCGALRAFGRALDRAFRVEHRLAPGEVLVVDNHRMLHGRDALPAARPRRLRRLWVRRRLRDEGAPT